MKLFWKGLGIVFLIGVLMLVGRLVLFPLFVANTAVDSAQGVVTKTLDSDNVLQNYEFFKQEYQDFLGINAKVLDAKSNLDNYEKELPTNRATWTTNMQEEDDNLRTVYNGVKAQRNNIIADYNAKSQMQNRALFKTKDLPDQLNQSDYSTVGGN